MSAITQPLPTAGLAAPASHAQAASRLPWHCFAVVLAALCIPIGVIWDISWHETIGRDTFWTPAHMMIYLGGALPGMLCGALVIQQTFWPRPGEPEALVRLWGFRGSFGGWVCIWGSLAMLVSAPFDNWWHDAYGLDVQILSPPHSLLALGMYGVAIGAMLLILAWRNRAEPGQQAIANTLFFLSCGTLVTMVTVFILEMTFPNHQHGAEFYRAVCVTAPFFPVAASRATGLRWAATAAAGIYMLIAALMLWILPLFPAHPMLGPIYNPVTHMVPEPFPLLTVFPALALDLLLRALGRGRGFWRDTALALLLGAAFFLVFLAVQWPFATFQLSPAARNPFFGGDMMWDYNASLGDWNHQFWERKGEVLDVLTLRAGAVAAGLAAVQCRLALAFGNWMAGVKR